MIHAYGRPEAPVPRLLAALAARGYPMAEGPASGSAKVLVLGPGVSLEPMALEVLFGAWRRIPEGRLLVLSLLGAHPDARAPRLKALWKLEELARGSGLPTLVLRLAPVVGPESPLWLKLRSRPRLPRGGRGLLNPVAEEDVLSTLERALGGRAGWEGWYEVAGVEALTLAELAALAAAAGPRTGHRAGAWEPPTAEMAEHRLAEAAPWIEHFGLDWRPIADRAREWGA